MRIELPSFRPRFIVESWRVRSEFHCFYNVFAASGLLFGGRCFLLFCLFVTFALGSFLLWFFIYLVLLWLLFGFLGLDIAFSLTVNQQMDSFRIHSPYLFSLLRFASAHSSETVRVLLNRIPTLNALQVSLGAFFVARPLSRGQIAPTSLAVEVFYRLVILIFIIRWAHWIIINVSLASRKSVHKYHYQTQKSSHSSSIYSSLFW